MPNDRNQQNKNQPKRQSGSGEQAGNQSNRGNPSGSQEGSQQSQTGGRVSNR